MKKVSIVVTDCDTCERIAPYVCTLKHPDFSKCPLPKWPSTDMGTIELFLKAAEEVGVSPTYLAAWLKSIGVEI